MDHLPDFLMWASGLSHALLLCLRLLVPSAGLVILAVVLQRG